MSDFSDRPFVAGSLVGLRAFDVDRLGRLVGPSYGTVFTPAINEAECLRPRGAFAGLSVTFTPGSYSYIDEYTRKMLGFPATSSRPAPPPQPKQPEEPAPHTLGGVGCSCGYYAYFDGGHDYNQPDRVTAIIEGFGVCTVGSRGFRASKARLVALAMRPERRDEHLRRLVLRNYPDVPVYGSRAAAVQAHPLSEGLLPSPEDDNFWTVSAWHGVVGGEVA